MPPFSLKNHPTLTLGGVVAAAAATMSSKSTHKYSLSNIASAKPTTQAPKKPTTTYSSTTRPNLFVSKQTDQKLEQLAKNSSILQPNNSSKRLTNNNIQQVVTSSKKNSKSASESTKQNLQLRQRLTECLDTLAKKASAHCDSLDMWTYESIAPVTIKEAKPLVFKAKSSDSGAANLTSANAEGFCSQTRWKISGYLSRGRPSCV
jgi:ribosomal protein L9